MSLYDATTPGNVVNVLTGDSTDQTQTDISLLPKMSVWWSASHHLPALVCCWRTASLGLTVITGERRNLEVRKRSCVCLSRREQCLGFMHILISLSNLAASRSRPTQE